MKICDRIVCFLFQGLPTPTMKDKLSVTFILVLANEKRKACRGELSFNRSTEYDGV